MARFEQQCVRDLDVGEQDLSNAIAGIFQAVAHWAIDMYLDMVHTARDADGAGSCTFPDHCDSLGPNQVSVLIEESYNQDDVDMHPYTPVDHMADYLAAGNRIETVERTQVLC